MKSILPTALVAVLLTACSQSEGPAVSAASRNVVPDGDIYTVRATPFTTVFEAAGTAAPLTTATLSTKLMGTVVAVYVREGDTVVEGQPLVRIDARDLTAKAAQVDAGIAAAESMWRDAEANATRMRSLYAQDAAPKAQLDAAETGLARAEAAVRSARANAGELAATRAYAVVRAPNGGVVTARMVDPGAFASPGAPLITVQDARRLRIRVTAAPEAARNVRRGMALKASIEGQHTIATVEGVVPAASGNMYAINAIVPNAAARFMPGSAATLSLPLQARTALTIPAAAVVREGDLTGVYVQVDKTFSIRWIRIGDESAGAVEVLSGLKAGDEILVVRTVAGVH